MQVIDRYHTWTKRMGPDPKIKPQIATGTRGWKTFGKGRGSVVCVSAILSSSGPDRKEASIWSPSPGGVITIYCNSCRYGRWQGKTQHCGN